MSLIFLLSACKSTQHIVTGKYQTALTSVETHDDIEFLHVDAKTRTVSLQYYGNVMETLTVALLPREQWREGCPTNTSIDIMETWQLTSDNGKQKDPVYLFASCGGSLGLVMEVNTRTLVFKPITPHDVNDGKWVETVGTIIESGQMPDGVYAYTIQYNVIGIGSHAVNMEGDLIQGLLPQHIFGGTKQVKQGQKLKLKYEADDPMHYELLETIVFVEH
jgi:hypothetical protein